MQKKCIIASSALHLLLMLVLVVGPGFLASKNKTEDVATIDFVPTKFIDAALSGGGNPNAKPPPAVAPMPTPPATVTPPPKPQPQKEPEPEPAKDSIKEFKKPKDDPDSFQLEKDTKKKKPQVSTTAVNRKTETKKTSKLPPEPDPQVKQLQQLADARRKAAEMINRSANSLRNDLSSSTTVETNYGPGGGGEAYANYAAWVKTKYENAWVLPDDTASDDAVAKVSVTIASDGTVLSARISRFSGDAQVDGSVQRTLERVTFIAPFPEGAKEKQRSYTINFNLKAKRGLG